MDKQTDIFNNSGDRYPKIAGGIAFRSNAILAFSKGGRGGQVAQSGESRDDITGAYQGMVIQNYQIQYQQNVTKLKGLNTPDITAVVAPPNGTFSVSSSVTKASAYYNFITDFGNVCNVGNNTMQVSNENVEECNDIAGMEGSGDKAWSPSTSAMPNLTMTGCLINQIQMSQQIENLILSSTVSVEFVALLRNT